MNVVVTTGPSHEPVDEVRRLTNFSTGELGVLLANQLAKSGCHVSCLRGVSATYLGQVENCVELPFTTNDDLFAQLTRLSREQRIDAVFHVAALCDFKVKTVENAEGAKLASAKIDSRTDSLTIHLEPARKLIGDLRDLFPQATLVGWKHELVGSRSDALAKAWRQLCENRTDACVLNGRAWGEVFALCTPPDQIHELRDKAEVAQFLPDWLKAYRAGR